MILKSTYAFSVVKIIDTAYCVTDNNLRACVTHTAFLCVRGMCDEELTLHIVWQTTISCFGWIILSSYNHRCQYLGEDWQFWMPFVKPKDTGVCGKLRRLKSFPMEIWCSGIPSNLLRLTDASSSCQLETLPTGPGFVEEHSRLIKYRKIESIPSTCTQWLNQRAAAQKKNRSGRQ